MPFRSSLRKRLLFAAVPVLVAYLVLEAVATAVAWASWWGTSFWLFEDSGRTWRFDPVRGYRLSGTPSRFLRSTHGTLEYVGTARGNAQGFPDRDDFTVGRPTGVGRRYVVFGDSFTEGQYLGQNWPDRAEDLARAAGTPRQFLNVAVSGGGLANWWSLLTRFVAEEGYEVDGVIFAVFAGDLRRTFAMWDHREGVHPRFGRTPGWDPATFPRTWDEARPLLREHPAFILAPEEFERALQGRWPRPVPRRLRPFLLTTLWHALRPARPEAEAPPPGPEDPGRARLIADLRRVLEARQLPALVVHLPDRPSLLDPRGHPAWALAEARAFAESLGAEFLDGTEAFAGLRPEEIRAQFLPYDGHWNQAGSNRFAAFLVRHLDREDRPEGGSSRARRRKTPPARIATDRRGRNREEAE